MKYYTSGGNFPYTSILIKCDDTLMSPALYRKKKKHVVYINEAAYVIKT